MDDPGYTSRLELADELDSIGWPSVADDIREGVSPDVVIERLRDIGEGDSEAAMLIEEFID